MGDPELLGDPRRHRSRAVAPRGDEAARPERGGEALDGRLVLDRDDAAAVREPETGRAWIAVAGRGPDPERPRGPQKPELRRARSEDEQAPAPIGGWRHCAHCRDRARRRASFAGSATPGRTEWPDARGLRP